MKSSYFNRVLLLLNNNPRRGKRLIGLNATALWELWQRVIELDEAAQQQRANKLGRKRLAGGGRKKAVDVLCRLLVALIYLRQHWTMQVIAECVEVAESTMFNYVHEMLPKIEASLPASLLKQWQQECSNLERLELEQCLNSLPQGLLPIDAWEQPITIGSAIWLTSINFSRCPLKAKLQEMTSGQKCSPYCTLISNRPLQVDKQKEYYSGKKKQHIHKNQVIILLKGVDIVDVKVGVKGKLHNSKLLLHTQAELPERLPLIGDKAYVGRDNTLTPFKKPRGGQLSEVQKTFNHSINQQRVYVEHIIRLVKIFRIAKETFRMREQMYERAIRCICGLAQLRVQYA